METTQSRSALDQDGPIELLPAMAYAAERCGFLVTRNTRSRFSAKELARWDRALSEYAQHKLAELLAQPARELPPRS